jgi:hypothetical protein
MVKYRVLKSLFGPTRQEITGGLRKLRNEEPYGLYPSPCITTVIVARRSVNCAVHVLYMGEVKIRIIFYSGTLK